MITTKQQILIEMLTYRRPAGSDTEERFIEKFIDPLGATKDKFGNRILRIGTAPVMWSCHTDTVHFMEGTQTLHISKNIVSVGVGSRSNSNCLGADCTTGVWIMTEMIKAGVEGLYIFHRAEERGGQGSKWIVNNTPELVEGIKFAIAFDRYGEGSIISYQMDKCASKAFVQSVAQQMPNFYDDPNGIFTDTAFYTGLISECTNLSVGYMGHHSSNETQDLDYAEHVLNLVSKLDISKLVASRPLSVPYKSSGGRSYNGYDDGPAKTYRNSFELESYDDDMTDYMGGARIDTDENVMYRLCKQNPEAAASLLILYGVSALELVEHAFSVNK